MSEVDLEVAVEQERTDGADLLPLGDGHIKVVVVKLGRLARVLCEGTLQAAFSAHPKLDVVHDELLTFSYQAKGDGTKDIVFYALNRDGRVIDEIWFEMPWPWE